MLRPFCSVGTGKHSTHRAQTAATHSKGKHTGTQPLCSTAGTSTVPRGRRRRQQEESDPTSTILLTNVSFAPSYAPEDPFGAHHPLEDLAGQIKITLHLFCWGKLWERQRKTLSDLLQWGCGCFGLILKNLQGS